MTRHQEIAGRWLLVGGVTALFAATATPSWAIPNETQQGPGACWGTPRPIVELNTPRYVPTNVAKARGNDDYAPFPFLMDLGTSSYPVLFTTTDYGDSAYRPWVYCTSNAGNLAFSEGDLWLGHRVESGVINGGGGAYSQDASLSPDGEILVDVIGYLTRAGADLDVNYDSVIEFWRRDETRAVWDRIPDPLDDWNVLANSINSAQNGYDILNPCFDEAGEVLYFARRARVSGDDTLNPNHWEIVALGLDGNPTPDVSELNFPDHNNRSPFVDSDGTRLYFASDYGTSGDYDIWVSEWDGSGWGEPDRPGCLDEINTSAHELDPAVGFDRLFFAREVTPPFTPGNPDMGEDFDLFVSMDGLDYDVPSAVPFAPLSVTASWEKGYVNLDWSTAAGEDVLFYRVYREEVDPVSGAVRHAREWVGDSQTMEYDDYFFNATGTAFADVKLRYWVTAVNARGESALPMMSNAQPAVLDLAKKTTASRVEGMSVTLNPNDITIGFTGSPLNSFFVQKSIDSVEGFTHRIADGSGEIPGSIGTLQYVDDDVDVGVRYVYSIQRGSQSQTLSKAKWADEAPYPYRTAMIASLIDMDGNGAISALDEEIFRLRFAESKSLRVGEPGFDRWIDLDADGEITSRDQWFFEQQYGRGAPATRVGR